MTTTALDYSPENPRNWNPNHPTLMSPYAPHETGAVLRAQRGGRRGTALAELFKPMPLTRLMKQLEREVEAENSAHRSGRVIYDGSVKR